MIRLNINFTSTHRFFELSLSDMFPYQNFFIYFLYLQSWVHVVMSIDHNFRI